MTKRNVKHRNLSSSSMKIKQPRISSSRTKRFFDVQKQRRITAFKLLIAAMATYLAARFIKFMMYSVFYADGSEPDSTVRLFVLYIQSALLITTFGLLLFSMAKVIMYLLKYEG